METNPARPMKSFRPGKRQRRKNRCVGGNTRGNTPRTVRPVFGSPVAQMEIFLNRLVFFVLKSVVFYGIGAVFSGVFVGNRNF